jgi:hypothetical protein
VIHRIGPRIVVAFDLTPRNHDDDGQDDDDDDRQGGHAG